VKQAIRDVLDLDLPKHGADGLLASKRVIGRGAHETNAVNTWMQCSFATPAPRQWKVP